MAKRFIDTNIFRKSFMKDISVEAKLFYVYLFCECDHCGIWQVEFEVAKVRLGLINLTEQDILDFFADKIFVFDNGYKWFLPQFILFQYGDLKANNKIHKSVINSLTKFNLFDALNDYDDNKHLPNPLQRVKDKDKDKDMVKDMVKDKEKGEIHAKMQNVIGNDLPIVPISDDIRTKENVKKRRKTQENALKSKEYQQFMSVYVDFIKNQGLPTHIKDVDGKALKSIIAYINDIETIKNGTKSAIDVWQFILNNWNKLSAWLQTQVQLRQINSQLPNIIQSLRQNGKQTNNNTTSAQQLAEALRGVIQNGNSL